MTNRHLVTDLSIYAFTSEIVSDGSPSIITRLPSCEVASGEVSEFDVSWTIELAKPMLESGREVFVTFRLALSQATCWAPEGHVVAWEQFQIKTTDEKDVLPTGPVETEETNAALIARDGTAVIRISKESGLPDCYSINGTELLVQPLRWNFWRALTDNDEGWKVDKKLGIWKDAGSTAKVTGFTPLADTNDCSGLAVVIEIPAPKASIHLRYVFAQGGILHTEATFEIEQNDQIPDLPRLGVQFAVPATLDQVAWFGRGPHENYWDHKTSAAIGHHQSTVNDWITHYVRPQENANRWLTLTNKQGNGLRIAGTPATPLSMSAWPYSQEDLSKASHDWELPTRDFITVNLDHLQMGVGGDNSWGLPVNVPYLVKPDRSYRWAFSFSPASNR